ncbi:MAG: O-methyltransferase [Acidiferrobacteraceae bacterium]
MEALLDPALAHYCETHSHPPGPLLREIEHYTREHFSDAEMLVGPVEGALLALLVRLSGARRVLEIGLFTGYSALTMAEALPREGVLVSCEIRPDTAAVAQRFFDRSPHGAKIRVRMGPALDTLEGLRDDEPFDLAFLDADKENYGHYYDRLRMLVRSGGLIIADNTLWSGRVLAPKNPSDLAIAAFNRRVREDPHVESVLLPVRDGMTIIRRKD